ncbi:MAG: ABC transporter permease [Parvibaculaceae bacterium]
MQRGVGLAMTVPAIMMLIAVFFAPLFILVSTSLHLDKGFGELGLELTLLNYWRFITDGFYLRILADTLVLGAIVVAICAIIGYPVAYYLIRSSSKAKAALIFLVVSPLLISAVVRNLGWIPILGKSGLVNWILTALGLVDEPIQLVGNFTGVVIGLAHALLPFMVLSLMTIIQRIEPSLEEASASLGAAPLQTFWRVLLPLSAPGLVSGCLLVFTIAIAAFVTPAMLGGKRVLVMATYIDQQIRSVMNYGSGATAAIILMLAAGGLTMIALRISPERRS